MAGIALGDDDAEVTIQRAQKVVRGNLGMEVLYVSEFVDDLSVCRTVDAT